MEPERPACLRVGLLAFTALLLAFLVQPLTRLSDHHYTSADFLTNTSKLLAVDPEHVTANPVLSDEGTEMLPWLLYDRAELRAGRLPLWNPLNGGGVPQLANYQAAVLSPFSLPYYLLPLKAALVVGRGLELLALGLFTFLFLRELGLGTGGALLGGVAFAFCGHSVLLLGYPHGDATVGMPLGLFLVERALRRSAERRSIRCVLVLLALGVAATLLAGQPEPAFFSLLLVATYALARLVGLARAGAGRSALGLGLRLAAAAALGVGLAAPQILPFLEYLNESAVALHREGEQSPIPREAVQLALFPNAVGDPAAGRYLGEQYELWNMAYAGGAVLLLLSIAPAFLRRARGLGFFLVAIATWVVYAFDPLGLGAPFEWIPVLADAPRNRSQPIFLFCAAAAAAIALDALVGRSAPPRRAAAGAVLLVGAALLVAGLLGARALGGAMGLHADPEVRAGVATHLAWIAAVQVAATLALAGLFVVRARRGRSALAAVAVACVFLQTGWLLRSYNPTVPDSLVFPHTEAVEDLRAAADGRRVMSFSAVGIPPHVNQVYGLAVSECYDALWIRRYDELYHDLFRPTGNWRMALQSPRRALDLFGLELVLSPWPWVHDRTIVQRLIIDSSVPLEGISLSGGQTVTQSFTATRDGLDAIALYLTRTPGTETCAVEVRILDDETGRELSTHTFPAGLIGGADDDPRRRRGAFQPPVDPPGEWLVLPFERVADSALHTFRLEVRAPQMCPGGEVLVIAQRSPYAQDVFHCRLAVDGRPEVGLLLANACFDQGSWELLLETPGAGLYRRLDAPDPYRLVDEILLAPGDLEARYILRHADLDVLRTAVVSAEDPGAEAALGIGVDYRDLPGRVVLVDEVRLAFVDDESRRALRLETSPLVVGRPDPAAMPPGMERDAVAEFDQAAGLEDFIASATSPPSPAPALREGEARVRVVSEGPTAVVLDVETDRPRVLVSPRAAYPGWRVRVDGEDRPSLRVDHAFLGAAVDAGRHRVELRYVPRSFQLGLALALASAALLAALSWRAGQAPASNASSSAVKAS